MRISDWSSDVCSSDLPAGVGRDYDFSGLFNQPGNDVELGGVVAGRFFLELLRQNWEMCEIPLLICRIIVVGQEIFEKMPDSPCDDLASGDLDMTSGSIATTHSYSDLTADRETCGKGQWGARSVDLG